MRLFTCLGNCDEALREEAYSRIVDIAEDPDRTGFTPEAEELAASQQKVDSLIARQSELLAEWENGEVSLRLEQLRDRFGLDGDEMLLLTAVLAPAVDDRFREIYKLFRGGEEPRTDFLLSLIERDGLGRYAHSHLLGRESRLVSRGIIESLSGEASPKPSALWHPAPGLLQWLNGTRNTDIYDGRGRWHDKPDRQLPGSDILISAATAVIMAGFNSEPVPMLSIYGPDAELLADQARAFAGELERPYFSLDLDGVEKEEAMRLLRLALRDCMLDQALLVLTGISGWIDSWGFFTAEIGRFFEKWDVPTALLTDRQFVFSPNAFIPERLILRDPVEGLTGTRRYSVWKKNIEGLPLADDVDESALRTLAGQFTLNSAQIRSAVNAGLGKAVTEDRDLTISDLYEGARVSSMHHLADLAKKMESRYTLADLILPEKQAQDINALIAMARNRSLVLEDWGVGKKLVSGRGISALFTGLPGTGKTLSAQVIAGELGLEIYRVDLSTVVSKYIGETEKNLERIFTEAQSSNVILFFDEADSLFGRRSDVSDSHDRYANIEVGYLLQRIETYDGIVLMATNLGSNLDEAFARRIHFIIDFPFPDEETRLRLWELLVPDNIEKDPDIDLKPLASYKIAGGSIRNAVVWAIYSSARSSHPLAQKDLLHGIEREYQKMGRVFK